MTLLKYGSTLWSVGHKTVTLFPDETATSVPQISGLGEPISQQGTTRERPIMGLLHRNRGMTRESTIRSHPFQRYRKVNTKPHLRTLRSYSPSRARRHKTHIEPRHTTVMADRDPHGRIVEGGAISKRGPLNTIGTGVTNSMTSPHRPQKTR
jgi:hypothetical protein